MNNNLPNLINAAFNRPLALEASYARIFFSALSQRLGNVLQMTDTEGNVLRSMEMKQAASSFSSNRSAERSYQVINGIAVVPISGSMVHKYGHVKPYSGMTGYDGIMYRLTEALSDPDVRGVMLDMNTPGGMIAGCFDLADKIAEYRQIKPIWSLGYDMHCSAGQMIASACNRRIITQTAVAGSVGVIMAHTNVEKMLAQQGVEITLITAGERKADGNPYQSLPADVREKWQAELESNRMMFATKAAQYMNISVEQILATEAETYEGHAAVDVGFADEIVNGHDAVQIMADHFNNQSKTFDMGATMSVDATNPEVSAANSEAPQVSAATTETPSAQASASGVEENVIVDAAQQERERCMGILQLPEAEGRQELAFKLASNPKFSVEEAKDLLASVPASASSNAAALQALASEHGQPLAASTGSDEVSPEQANINALAASYSKTD
ncbi:S49 family peptidase [Vibrio metschnikovii]|nr:S49 family peptidase [Vibrio metschnikovii]